MNVFSRIKGGIRSLLAAKRARVEAIKDGNVPHAAPIKAHLIRFRHSKGRSVFGPAFDVPRADHHVSRETCRHYLRTRFFASISAANPLMSRKDRRRYARLFACLEYRRMMGDPTNAIPDDAERVYRNLTGAELAA